jgi:hypothetical protein
MVKIEPAAGNSLRIHLASVYLPIALAMISNLQQSILGIVALSAVRTDEITAPGCALPVIVFCDGEGCAATAGQHKHSQVWFGV